MTVICCWVCCPSRPSDHPQGHTGTTSQWQPQALPHLLAQYPASQQQLQCSGFHAGQLQDLWHWSILHCGQQLTDFDHNGFCQHHHNGYVPDVLLMTGPVGTAHLRVWLLLSSCCLDPAQPIIAHACSCQLVHCHARGLTAFLSATRLCSCI